MIQKYEADIRNHIKVEQQMKLHSDSVIDKLEEKEKECSGLEEEVTGFRSELGKVEAQFRIDLKAKDEEVSALKRALETKIDRVMALERESKELHTIVEQLKTEALPTLE